MRLPTHPIGYVVGDAPGACLTRHGVASLYRPTMPTSDDPDRPRCRRSLPIAASVASRGS